MSGVGYRRDRAEREHRTHQWRSGFCNGANPRDSHERCPIDLRGLTCCCSCHQTPAAEVARWGAASRVGWSPSSATEVPSEAAAASPAAAPWPPGLYDDIPEVVYHADRSSLSSSGAKTLLKESPARFRWQQDHPVHRDVFDFGSAAHALVLGAGMESIYVAPFDNWQTKAAQTERKIAHADGLSPILPKDWDVVAAMADELARHTLAMQLLSKGRPEVSAYAVDVPTGVLRRGRFDWLGDVILTDYKTADCSAPGAFRRNAPKYGYHQQGAWYLDLANDAGHPVDAFAFIVQEKSPPYIVTVIELDRAAIARGRELNRRALEMFRDCTAADRWPGYVPDTEFSTVSLPPWAFYDDEDDQ